MNRVKQLRAAKPIKPSNDDLQTEKPKEPVDLSKLEGVYPLTVVGGLFVKKGNHAEVILGLQFDHPEMNHMRIDVTLKHVNFGNIIVPGIQPVPVNPIIKS